MDPLATSPRLRSVAYQRALRFGLVASVLAHMLGLLIYPRLAPMRVRPPLPDFLPATSSIPPRVSVIDVVTMAPPSLPPAPARTESRVPEVPTATPPSAVPEGVSAAPGPVPGAVAGADAAGVGAEAGAGAGAGAGAESGPGATAAERLRPIAREAILWAPIDPALTEPSLEQRLRLELAVRLAEAGDSAAAAMAAAAATTDWTYTDAEGRRWGVSPGEIHLGGITIPLPFAFGTSPGKRDEVNRRIWEWNEMQRAAISGGIRETWRDRAEAIRERRDLERAESFPDTAAVPR